MSTKTSSNQTWAIASFAIADAVTDFMLSRQAKSASAGTLRFYGHTVGAFVKWLEAQSVTSPGEVTARHVRAYLAELTARSLADTYIHGHARAIKTLLRFWHAEGYMTNAVKFEMPKLSKKRLPVLDADQVSKVLAACASARDKALLLFAVDTGLRLSEIVSLSWRDIDMNNGLIILQRGKGGKSRSAVLGATGRRALLAYRRTLPDAGEHSAIFQTKDGERLTSHGLHQLFKRVSKRAGVMFSAHALRRTFCILSLRSGMNEIAVSALMGHASLEMTRHYAQMLDEDTLAEHRQHSPIDNLYRLKKR